MTPHEERLALGGAAVLTEAEAVRLLPCRDGLAREWLRSSGLVHETPIGRVVVWSQVVAALLGEQPAKPARGTLARAGVYRPKR